MKKEENITWDCLLHGNVVYKHDLFYRLTNKISWQKLYKLKISAFIYSGKGDNGKLGHFKMFQGRWDISIIWETGHSMLWEKGHFILWETGNSILWERFYPLGIGTLILWESDHLSSGFGTSSGKRDTLSSGIRTTYPLGNILLETSSGKHPLENILWETSSGKHPLGIGNLGDEVQPLESLVLVV